MSDRDKKASKGNTPMREKAHPPNDNSLALTPYKSASISGKSAELDFLDNPFKMPEDGDVFALRDEDRRKRKELREKQKTMKIHEKLPALNRIGAREAALIAIDDEDSSAGQSKKSLALRREDAPAVTVTRDRILEKETLTQYIDKKREMFLLQYSLGVKSGEMQKLEDIASAEEKKLEMAERYLEEDAAMFDDFLKENDKNSVEAMRIAEDEARAKAAKLAEIKRINTNMLQITSEINKYLDQLKEYKTYKEFLDRLVPEEEQLRRQERRLARQKEREKLQPQPEPVAPGREKTDVTMKSMATSKKSEKSRVSVSYASGSFSYLRGRASIHRDSVSNVRNGHHFTGRTRRASSISLPQPRQRSYSETDRIDKLLEGLESDEDGPGELYFTDPGQLMNMFTELEESNLSLIQNCQESEEQVEELKHLLEISNKRIVKERSGLAIQIDELEKVIAHEREKLEEFEAKSKLFGYGQYRFDEEQEFLQEFKTQVESVYRTCVADSKETSTQSTLQMLTIIERHIEELHTEMERLPEDKIEWATRAKEKERRLQQKEEKKEQQRLHQEERIRKALERAKEPPKKQTGRRIIGRSNPPQMKKKDTGLNDKQTREEEEMAYFFT